MFCFTYDEYGLAGERMKGVSDQYVESQTPAIMDSPCETLAATFGQRARRTASRCTILRTKNLAR